jgi:hypothetical protein
MGLDYVFSFLDDDSVYSKTKEQHWVGTPASTLLQFLAANPGEVVFAITELDFFGHRISTAGIAPIQKVILGYLLPLAAGNYNGT